jgi:hypothetical protein
MRTQLRTPASAWLCTGFAALVCTVVLFAQEKSTASNDEIQVRQLERAWNQAEAHHDVGAVTAIVADTLTYIDFDGSIMNKAEYLRDVTKTAYQADHLYDEGLKVKLRSPRAFYRHLDQAKRRVALRRQSKHINPQQVDSNGGTGFSLCLLLFGRGTSGLTSARLCHSGVYLHSHPQSRRDYFS